MKKTMSRILALIVALTILALPSAALAEERNFYTLTVGNFEVTYEDQTLSLPVSVSLGGAVDVEGERGALVMSLGAGEQTAASALATLESGEIRATLDGLGYNLFISLEQLVEFIEEQLGGSLEEVISSEMDAEMMSILEKLMAASAKMTEESAEAISFSFPDEFLTADGEEEITLYDETMTAEKYLLDSGDLSMTEFFELVLTTEAQKEYWAAYTEYMEYMLAQQGVEITLEEVLDMMALRYSGVLYTAENGGLGEIDMTMTVTEDEDTFSFTVPMSITTLFDEESLLMDMIVPITVDEETMTMQLGVEAVATEDMTSLLYDIAVSMSDDEEISDLMQMSVSTLEDADGVALNVAIVVDDGLDPVLLALDYVGTHMLSTAEADSWDGSLMLSAMNGDELYSVAMSTNLTASNLPEGELLAPTEGDLNVLELTDENVEQLTGDAQTVLMQALGVLMQDPTIAEMIAGMMY